MKKASRPVPPKRKPKPATKKAKAPVVTAPVVPKETAHLRERLSFLSSVLDETARRLLSRLRREIEETEEGLLRQSPKKQDKALRLIDALQVKPSKGRRKDLKKIDLLIGDLQKLTEEK